MEKHAFELPPKPLLARHHSLRAEHFVPAEGSVESQAGPRIPRYDVSRRIRREKGAEVLRGRAAYTLAQGVGVVGLHVGLLLGTASIGTGALFAGWGSFPWLGLALAPPAWFVIGSRMRALANIVHECVHGSFFRSQPANVFLGRTLALLDLHSFDDYVREHLSHHARLGVPGEDLDFEARRPFGFDRAETKPHAGFLARAFLLGHLPRYVRPRLSVAGEGAGWAASRLAWLAALAACALLAPGPFLAFIAFPWLTTYQLFRYWSDALDHAGCLHEEEEFLRSRNHLLRPRALEWLALPRNDAYHLVHHLFPSLPARHFPAVHREVLLSQADYAAREHAWRPFT